MIYYTSDTHFGHNNIIEYCNRPFSKVEEMDDYIINYWNRIVSKEDEVYHLGDFIFKGNCNKLISKLNGDIHLIKGNHDKKIKRTNFKTQGFKSFNYSMIKEIGNFKVLLSHAPYTYDEKLKEIFIYENCDFNVHGHLHGNIKKLEGGTHIIIKAEQRKRISSDKMLDIGWDVENKFYSEYELIKMLDI